MTRARNIAAVLAATLSFVLLSVPTSAFADNTYPAVTRESYTASGEAWVDVTESERVYLTTARQIQSASGETVSWQGMVDDIVQYLPEGETCLLAGTSVGFEGPALHWRNEDNVNTLECSTDNTESARVRSDVQIPFGFDIEFGGRVQNGGYIYPSGGLLFSISNQVILDESGAENVFSLGQSGIVPFGADMEAFFFPQGEHPSTEIWTAQTTIEGKNAFVASWQNIKRYDDPQTNYSFQLVIIDEAGNDFKIWLNYDQIGQDVDGYNADQIFVDVRDGQVPGTENEFEIYDIGALQNDICYTIDEFEGFFLDGSTDVGAIDAWSLIARDSSTVELFADPTCDTPIERNNHLGGVNYLNLKVSGEYDSAFSGFFAYDDSDPENVRVHVTEINPNVSISDIVDGGAQELIGNSANSDVPGRYIYTITGDVVSGDSRIDAPTRESRPTPTCELLPARSALVDGEVFLGGDFIELGLSAKGSWGTEGSVPEGFRGTPDGDGRLGLGSDLDGYCATASDNVDLPIDFFMPGSEEERWSVGFEIDGERYFAGFSQIEGDVSSEGVEGTHVVTNETSGDSLSAKVVSIITLDSAPVLKVTAVHAFSKADAYFTTTVTLENLFGTGLTDVRYMRSFDPDNAVYQHGNYDTTNTVVSQASTSGVSIVEGKLSPGNIDYLSQDQEILNVLSQTSSLSTEIPILYYSREQNSVVYVGGFKNPNPYTPLYEYDEEEPTPSSLDFFESPQAEGETIEDDIAIGIIFREPTLAVSATSDPLVFVTSLDYRDYETSTLIDEVENTVEVVEAESVPDSSPAPVEPSYEYQGPEIISISNALAAPGDVVTISGKKLDEITSASIDGVTLTISGKVSRSIAIVVPTGLTDGVKSIVFLSSYGKLEYLRALEIKNPVAAATVSPTISQKITIVPTKNSVVIYVKGYQGQTLTWKIAGKWKTIEVTENYQVFKRATIWTDYGILAYLYMDQELLVSESLTTK